MNTHQYYAKLARKRAKYDINYWNKTNNLQFVKDQAAYKLSKLALQLSRYILYDMPLELDGVIAQIKAMYAELDLLETQYK